MTQIPQKSLISKSKNLHYSKFDFFALFFTPENLVKFYKKHFFSHHCFQAEFYSPQFFSCLLPFYFILLVENKTEFVTKNKNFEALYATGNYFGVCACLAPKLTPAVLARPYCSLVRFGAALTATRYFFRQIQPTTL